MRDYEETLDTLEKPETPEPSAVKTAKTTGAERLGLIATWSARFGYVSVHYPTTGDRHDLRTKDAPEWAVGEARRRKEQYKGGNRRAYRLTASEMEELQLVRDHEETHKKRETLLEKMDRKIRAS